MDLDRHLDEAVSERRRAWHARRVVRALASILEAARPPKLEPILARPRSAGELFRTSATLLRSPDTVLRGIKARLDQFDHRLDALSRLVVQKVEPDLHLLGRPYFVTETSPGNVAQLVKSFHAASSPGAVDNLAVEQLIRLDAGLARVEPQDGEPLSTDAAYRTEVFREVQVLSEISAAARKGVPWASPDGERKSAAEAVRLELPCIAVRVFARAAPFWIAREVDGLDTICRSAGVETPGFLASAARLFREAGEVAPAIAASLGRELGEPRDLAAFVSPEHVPDLLQFLATRGSMIIRAAARHGEGPAAAVLLKKIRECAVYAERHGFGYLEACGIFPPDVESVDWIPEEAPAAQA